MAVGFHWDPDRQVHTYIINTLPWCSLLIIINLLSLLSGLFSWMFWDTLAVPGPMEDKYRLILNFPCFHVLVRNDDNDNAKKTTNDLVHHGKTTALSLQIDRHNIYNDITEREVHMRMNKKLLCIYWYLCHLNGSMFVLHGQCTS